MKFIRDSVHGNLKVDELEIKLIDTPQIQRLRRIKQLGFTYLVYPGANHTRFEHSIGTMYLASRLAEICGWTIIKQNLYVYVLFYMMLDTDLSHMFQKE